jgi:hypothetical protein
VYKDIIIPGKTGFLVSNEQKVWIEAITNLLNTSALERKQLHGNALAWIQSDLKSASLL